MTDEQKLHENIIKKNLDFKSQMTKVNLPKNTYFSLFSIFLKTLYRWPELPWSELPGIKILLFIRVS